jgi:CubicO group peptidase (beta-lactamase class C family)
MKVGGGGRRGGAAGSSEEVPAERAITIRDLVTHTSGLGEYPRREVDPHMTLEQMAQLIAKQPLRFQPGTRWQYSTAGLDAVGRIVEVAGGMPFDKFLQTRIFDPLGMKDTTFWPKTEDLQRLAVSYKRDAQTGDLTPETIAYLYGGAIDDPKRPPLGGAGLFSTAEDLARFYQMMLAGGKFGGKEFVKQATVEAMTKNQIDGLTARPGMPWGLGFCVIADPTAMEANHTFNPGAWGHGGAFGTGSWVDPKRGEIFVIMLQRNGWGNPDNTPPHQDFNRLAAADFDKATAQ